MFVHPLHPGGFSPNPDSQPVPDWVDASVADWIVSETTAMNKVWGPPETRGALAFVHIPPFVFMSNVESDVNDARIGMSFRPYNPPSIVPKNLA